MLESLTLADFSDHVQTAFRIAFESGESFDLELIRAEALGGGQQQQGPPSGSERLGRPGGAFSLMFRGPLRPILPQQIYRMVHDVMGTLEIFIVPIGTEGDPQGMHYQAVFN